MKTTILAALVAATSLAAAMPASAVDLPVEKAHAGYRETGAAKDWVSIYSPSRGTEATRVCALYSRPTESAVFRAGEEVEVIRGELAAFINWNEKAPSTSSGEVSFIMGAPVQTGDADGHALSIGDVSVVLIGEGDRLYVHPKDDATVIEAIRKGTDMTVTAAMADGTMAKDHYSLYGVMATTSIAKESCE